jgi:type IX secretion system PorP/SprF family membrane protein
MNRLSLSILIFLLPLQLWGQLFPLSDHYINDALTINPASAGNNGALSTVILYRNQWAGFTDAPKRQMVSLQAPVFNDRVGLGLVIDRNTFGIFKETNLLGNYAYRMNLRDGTLALGMGFGLTVHNIAWNELIAADANDEKLMNAPASSVLPTFSLGAYYYTKKYFFGISMPYFLSQELDQGTGKYKNIYNLSGANYFFSGGCELGLNRTFKLLPSILVKYHPETAVQIDYNAQVSFKDKIWLGLGYRNKEMMVAMFQCQINYQIRLAYSYDFDLDSMGKYRNGSHEVVLNYIFRYSRKVMGPRQY